MSSTVPLGPKLVNVLNLPCQFLLARFRGANLCWMADLTFDSQLSRQVQKPVHRPGRFNAHAHRARKFGIKLPHAVTFVEQSCIHDLPGGGIQHRQGLLASVQIASYNSHSASFGPSAVRVNTETVYLGRSEADLVMVSTELHERLARHLPDGFMILGHEDGFRAAHFNKSGSRCFYGCSFR